MFSVTDLTDTQIDTAQANLSESGCRLGRSRRPHLPRCLPVLLLLWVAVAQAIAPAAQAQSSNSLCSAPVLSRLIRHRVAAGETLSGIAQRYNLIPATLMGINPSLRNGQVPVGADILIPPYNGIRVEVPSGKSWRDVARQYNIRADVLFEANGCQQSPRVVFVPGVNWSPSPTPTPAARANSPLTRYPLPATATLLRGYGWQLNPNTSTVVFSSGVDLQAAAGTPVLATGEGTVAFAGSQGDAGYLVVINHSQGLQTRYARLGGAAVQVGQKVEAGQRVGTVAADAEGSYLHFEVRTNSNLGWVAQDPGSYLQNLRNLRQGNRSSQ